MLFFVSSEGEGFTNITTAGAAVFASAYFAYLPLLPIKAYTRVLLGHIGLATSTFPDGTPGFMIDAFARRHLWDAGLDYQHGTGHGVGAALNVHEGPHVSLAFIAWGLVYCSTKWMFLIG